jgi:hypothetical protein
MVSKEAVASQGGKYIYIQREREKDSISSIKSINVVNRSA